MSKLSSLTPMLLSWNMTVQSFEDGLSSACRVRWLSASAFWHTGSKAFEAVTSMR